MLRDTEVTRGWIMNERKSGGQDSSVSAGAASSGFQCLVTLASDALLGNKFVILYKIFDQNEGTCYIIYMEQYLTDAIRVINIDN